MTTGVLTCTAAATARRPLSEKVRIFQRDIFATLSQNGDPATVVTQILSHRQPGILRDENIRCLLSAMLKIASDVHQGKNALEWDRMLDGLGSMLDTVMATLNTTENRPYVDQKTLWAVLRIEMMTRAAAESMESSLQQLHERYPTIVCTAFGDFGWWVAFRMRTPSIASGFLKTLSGIVADSECIPVMLLSGCNSHPATAHLFLELTRHAAMPNSVPKWWQKAMADLMLDVDDTTFRDLVQTLRKSGYLHGVLRYGFAAEKSLERLSGMILNGSLEAKDFTRYKALRDAVATVRLASNLVGGSLASAPAVRHRNRMVRTGI